jgi:hypothetical protein
VCAADAKGAAAEVDMLATAAAFGFPALGGLAFGYDIGTKLPPRAVGSLWADI